MYWEINVTKNGRHFFATAPRSCTDPLSLQRVFMALAERFDAADGYKITVTKWEEIGTAVPVSEIFEG